MRVRIWAGVLAAVLATATVAIISVERSTVASAATTTTTGAKAAVDCGDFCPDSDFDGVPDSIDQCPDTPQSVFVDEFGCTIGNPPPPDLDGDGVPDSVDQCPDATGPVDWQGCPDTDGDGRPDNVDLCPQDWASTADGCPAFTPPIANPDVAELTYDAAGNALPVDVNVTANDFDPDGGTIALEEIPDVDGTGWGVSISEAGTLRFVPPAGFSGQITFEYSISTERATTAFTTVTITGTPPVVCQPYDMDFVASRSGRIGTPDWSHRFEVCHDAASGGFALDGFDGVSRVPATSRINLTIAYSSTPVRVDGTVTKTETRLASSYAASLARRSCVSLAPLRTLNRQLHSNLKWFVALLTLRVKLVGALGPDTGGRLFDQIARSLGTTSATACANQSLVTWSAAVGPTGIATLRWSTGDVARYLNPTVRGQVTKNNAVVVRSGGVELGRASLHQDAVSVEGRVTCTSPSQCQSVITEHRH